MVSGKNAAVRMFGFVRPSVAARLIPEAFG